MERIAFHEGFNGKEGGGWMGDSINTPLLYKGGGWATHNPLLLYGRFVLLG